MIFSTFQKMLASFEGTKSFPYMPYNDQYRCIFIHIPKTGGTSILNSFDYYGGRHHCEFIYYKMSDIKKFNFYFKFSVVRNPFDRLVSAYAYLKNGGNRTDDVYLSNLINYSYQDFDSFVLNFLNKDTIQEIKIFKPQYLYICDYKQKIVVDYVAKFENLDKDFQKISNIINLNVPLGKKNKSIHDDFSFFYRKKETLKKVLYLYKKDFELFDYYQ